MARPVLFTAVLAFGIRPVLAQVQNTVREIAGPDAASIRPVVDYFRADLGPLNPNDPGSWGTGRREISWDNLPVTLDTTFAAPGVLPADFFNGQSSGQARGVVFSTADDLFQVSSAVRDPAALAKLAAPAFGNINPRYPDQFIAFSPERLFTPLSSNYTEIRFLVPGTNVPALTRGFGAIFVDVDALGSSRIEYYDANNNLLLSRNVRPANKGLSFLGASYPEAIISRVIVYSGSEAPGRDDVSVRPGGPDIVVLDDFIYGEPMPLPTLSISDIEVTEGQDGVTPAEFAITLTSSSTQEVSVSYATVDGTATALDNDFEPASGVITFSPGEITRTVVVNVVGDSQYESNETFTLWLSNAVGASIADNEGVAAISNDDEVPGFSIDDPHVNEGNQGTIAQFTVSLSNPTFLPASVNYKTVSGTAQQNVDYRAESGTLMFAPGVTQQHIDVLIYANTEFGVDKSFTVQLESPVNAQLRDDSGTGTITNDDPGAAKGSPSTAMPACAPGVGVPALTAMVCLWFVRGRRA